jgi:hypothetical protein
MLHMSLRNTSLFSSIIDNGVLHRQAISFFMAQVMNEIA